MSYFLRTVARSAFVMGMVRSLDLFGALNQPMSYRADRSPTEQDAHALASDWQMVGRDVATAFREMADEHEGTVAA